MYELNYDNINHDRLIHTLFYPKLYFNLYFISFTLFYFKLLLNLHFILWSTKKHNQLFELKIM